MGRKRNLSLNCSLSFSSEENSLTTPDILDRILNIVVPHTDTQETLRKKYEGKIEMKINEKETSVEEKRRKRRERNKIAATKCRNKKKAQTEKLLKENEEVQELNEKLKLEIRTLETEEKNLKDLLDKHKASCNVQKSDKIEFFLPTDTLVGNTYLVDSDLDEYDYQECMIHDLVSIDHNINTDIILKEHTSTDYDFESDLREALGFNPVSVKDNNFLVTEV